MYYMLIYEMIGVVKLKQGLTKVNGKKMDKIFDILVTKFGSDLISLAEKKLP